VSASPPPGERRIRRFRRVARVGFAVNGLIHFLIGGITLRLAFGDSTVSAADQSGALSDLSGLTIGRLLLWVAVVGLMTLGLWQITRATVQLTHPRFALRWGRRVVEAAKGVFYLFLGSTALVFALGGSTRPSESLLRLSAALLRSQEGVVILLVIGLATLGAGIGFVSIGIRRSFTKLIDLPVGRWRVPVLVLGAVGYIAKGIALAAAGMVFGYAAITGDARQASGLDGALRILVGLPFGNVLVALVGGGLILYGVFLVVRTRLARL
jgi:hypothetical protein